MANESQEGQVYVETMKNTPLKDFPVKYRNFRTWFRIYASQRYVDSASCDELGRQVAELRAGVPLIDAADKKAIIFFNGILEAREKQYKLYGCKVSGVAPTITKRVDPVLTSSTTPPPVATTSVSKSYKVYYIVGGSLLVLGIAAYLTLKKK